MAKSIKQAGEKHTITEQDIELNPELKGQVEVGEEVELGPIYDAEPEPEPEIYGAKRHYQEWLVQINDGKAEQLKITRECVKITEEQAEILNQGVVEGGNAIAKMYFLKEK